MWSAGDGEQKAIDFLPGTNAHRMRERQEAHVREELAVNAS